MTPPTGQVLALHLGRVRQLETAGTGEWWDKPWQTGFYKEARDRAWLGYEGFQGDEQADRRVHGGVDKAVCVYPGEHRAYWLAALPDRDWPHGAFGENLTTAGLLEENVRIGDVYAIGGALVEVSQPRQPCWKLARRWQLKDLTARVERIGFTGWYFRVKRHGRVSTGDAIQLLERPFPEWTIGRCNEIMHHGRSDPAATRALAECPALSASWKDGLWARGASAPSTDKRVLPPD